MIPEILELLTWREVKLHVGNICITGILRKLKSRPFTVQDNNKVHHKLDNVKRIDLKHTSIDIYV